MISPLFILYTTIPVIDIDTTAFNGLLDSIRPIIDSLIQAEGNKRPSNPSIITTIITAIISTIYLIYTTLISTKIKDIHTERKRRKEWKETQLDPIYNHYNDYYPNRYYIQPYLTFTLNSNTSEQQSKQSLRDFFLKKVFIREFKGDNKVFFIFGDTGSGKTAALVHLLADYVHHYSHSHPPYPYIKLISLRRNQALDEIQQVQDKEKTILLLDALDETPNAQNRAQLDLFLQNLKNEITNYARVVMTCRPQLFPDLNTEKESIKPKVRNNTGWLSCTTLYLAPFNNKQINKYLNKVFVLEYKKRKKAKNILERPELKSIQPIVLTYIKDIVRSKEEIKTTLDFFDIIIWRLLEHNIRKMVPQIDNNQIQRWWEMSSEVAKYMYKKRELNISYEKLDDIDYIKQEKEFKQRSLLTRSDNEYRFSHTSFYDYFMAYRFFLHPDEIESVYNMDFTLQLYDELYKAFQDNPNRLSCYTHRDISKKSIAESLLNIGSALDLIQDFDAAESKYKDALSLFNDLNESELIAITLNNLGIIHFKAEKYKLAEKEFNEALTIRRTLAQENPNVYLPFVIMTLNNLASLHEKNALNDKAEVEKKEISCMLNNIDEQPNQCYLAMQNYNLARSYIEEDNISEAEAAAKESLYYFNQLASSQQAFNKDVQKVERMLIYIKQLKDSDKNFNNLE